MGIHQQQCTACGRFAFEKCNRSGLMRCPRDEVAAEAAPVAIPPLKPDQAEYLAALVAPPVPVDAIFVEGATAAPPIHARASEARSKGYTGSICPDCSNFTMVRNGTCEKCETCGGTTGCS